MSFRASDLSVVCSGLGYPEGPVAMPDGSVLLVELSAGTLSRISPEGQRSVVANVGGSPNGAAVGPDGKIYICNSGGFTFIYVSHAGVSLTPTPGSIAVTTDASPDYVSGSIQRVDLATGQVETLYTEAPGVMGDGPHPLRGPDDLVFDQHGGFWFTDWGKTQGRSRDVTGVFYALADGSTITEVLYPLNAPNGIALSPDGSRLYVAETYTRRVLAWDLKGPGQIDRSGPAADFSRLLTAAIPGQGILDSMKVDEEGNVYVVTMLPDGQIFESNGGITVISPSGNVLEFIELSAGGVFDPLPSNLCFGGPDRRTAFITLGGTGRLLACEMSVPGLRPAYELPVATAKLARP
jgi:gluconolactonase